MIWFVIKYKVYRSRIHLIRDIISESSFIVIYLTLFALLGEPSEETVRGVSTVMMTASIIILLTEAVTLIMMYYFKGKFYYKYFCRARKKRAKKPVDSNKTTVELKKTEEADLKNN